MLIRKGLERGAINGFRVTPFGIPITHLFFADDSVLGFRPENQFIQKLDLLRIEDLDPNQRGNRESYGNPMQGGVWEVLRVAS